MSFEWLEPLPSSCPPENAYAVDNEVFYRVCGNPIGESDFYSHIKLYPDKKYPNPCSASSVSILSTVAAAIQVSKLPQMKAKGTQSIVKVVLKRDSGLILQTGSIHHFSWWMSKAFNYNTACEKVLAE